MEGGLTCSEWVEGECSINTGALEDCLHDEVVRTWRKELLGYDSEEDDDDEEKVDVDVDNNVDDDKDDDWRKEGCYRPCSQKLSLPNLCLRIWYPSGEQDRRKI